METKINFLDDINQLEFHYIFDDEAEHFLNAYTKNACEKEFLAIIKTLSTDLNIQIDVSAEPPREGSYIDIYNFVCSQNGIAIVAWASLLLNLLQFILSFKTKSDKKEQELNIANQTMDLITKVEEFKQKGLQIPDNIEKKLEKIFKSHKVKKQKSNLYKKLSSEKRIKKLEIVTTQKDNPKRKQIITIPRTNFPDFYLDSDNLDSIIDSSAQIEIISPVLNKGTYLWRGYYVKESTTHEFKMLDKDFKNSVVEDGIQFQTGTFLECELEICRKLDDNGDEFNSQYKINKVFNKTLGDTVIEMPSGKKRREKKKLENEQPSLFDDLDNPTNNENK